MNPRRVYIAGPYTAPTPEERAENVRRVGVLTSYALSIGLAPVSVHDQIEAGQLAAPEEREGGLWATALVTQIAEHGGVLWAITRDDWSWTAGVRREVQAFDAAWPGYPEAKDRVIKPWFEWARVVR